MATKEILDFSGAAAVVLLPSRDEATLCCTVVFMDACPSCSGKDVTRKSDDGVTVAIKEGCP